MKQLPVIWVLVMLLSGCVASSQPSLKELDASLAYNKSESERLYPEKTIEEVRKASERVLYLLDPSDIQFDVQDNQLLATRWSTFYAVFSVGFGRDWYSVKFTQERNGTRSKFGYSGQMNAGMFPSAIPVSFKSDISVSAHQNMADFKLFHDRVEYLLGLRPNWPSCKEVKASQPNPNKAMALCDSLGLENRAP